MSVSADALPALRPLAVLLAQRKITAREFDAVVTYLAENEGERSAIEARMPLAEGKIVHHLLILHPADAVRRTVGCSRGSMVHHLRKALDQLSEALPENPHPERLREQSGTAPGTGAQQKAV